MPRARAMALLAGALALAACERSPGPASEPTAEAEARPALWEIAGPGGAVEGWLFGTVHALPDGTAWRTATLDGLVAGADLLVVEVADLEDVDGLSRIFSAMAFDTPGTPPLARRVDPALRERYAELAARSRIGTRQLDRMESWAAALSLAQVAQGPRTGDGVDKVLLREFGPREVIELEGAAAQLRIFDGLPEPEQRDLLDAVIEESIRYEEDPGRLVETWRTGDLAGLEAITTGGMLADPELYEALLARRNRAWAERLDALLARPERPFVAVGAGHMLGDDGLPALLAARGFTVRRVQ